MTYKELDVWEKSMVLVNVAYTLTKSFPKEELFGLTNQIRKCAVSIPSNIAEGCGRDTYKDTLRFLFISRGSLYELETQMLISYDQKLINSDDKDLIINLIIECKKLLNGFINYYQKLNTIN